MANLTTKKKQQIEEALTFFENNDPFTAKDYDSDNPYITHFYKVLQYLKEDGYENFRQWYIESLKYPLTTQGKLPNTYSVNTPSPYEEENPDTNINFDKVDF